MNRADTHVKLVSAYLGAVITSGSVILLWTLFNWHSDDILRFASFLIAGAFASGLKLRLPGVTETASVSVLVIVVAIAHLSLSEAVIISAVAMLVQCTWHTRTRPRPIQVAFSVCTLAVSVFVSALVFGYVRKRTFEIISMEGIAFVYFAVNSFLVAAIISLTERKRLLVVWAGNQWALAFYCIGASFAWLIGTFPPSVQWELPIICLPLVYLVYRSNRTYLVQMEQRIREEGLLRSQEELERRVLERTSELAEANHALEFEVDARKRTETDLRSAKEAAEMGSRAKSEFLANMSHEIRTPMNGIIGMTELAMGTDLTSEQRQYLKTVMLSASAMMTVINDILDFARIEARKLRLDPADFSVAECVSEAARTLAVEAHQKGLELSCDLRSNVPEVTVGDRYRLRQILLNLLSNAIKFTETGEVVVRVETVARAGETVDLHFQVKDTGIGIPKDKLGIIFEAFSQADGSWTRKYGGTGLGLTISSRLVNMMDGKMWVDSDPGQGSTFHFTARFGLHSLPQPAGRQYSELRGLRILVVEDNATNRDILAEMFHDCGVETTLVGSGESALAVLESQRTSDEPFSLVLVDQQMPKMDGFRFVEQLRNMQGQSSVPIIMMLTARGRASDAACCEQLGINANLFKPIIRTELLDTIVAALTGQSREKDSLAQSKSESSYQKSNSLRILIAEDIPENQAVLVGLLNTRGYIAKTVWDGQEALDALEDESFDVVLMDVQMPKLDGIEATAAIRIKEKSSGAHIPIIAVTAYAMPGDRERCLEAGMDAYLSKPILAHELFDVIERFTPPSKQLAQAATAISDTQNLRDISEERVNQRNEKSVGLNLLVPIEQAIADKDLKTLRAHATAMKGSVTALIAKRAFETALVLANTSQPDELVRAETACQGLHDALMSLTEIEEHADSQQMVVLGA